MSATFAVACFTTWAVTLKPGLRFSSLMTDDTKSIARGLKQRNPQLLDVLIE